MVTPNTHAYLLACADDTKLACHVAWKQHQLLLCLLHQCGIGAGQQPQHTLPAPTQSTGYWWLPTHLAVHCSWALQQCECCLQSLELHHVVIELLHLHMVQHGHAVEPGPVSSMPVCGFPLHGCGGNRVDSRCSVGVHAAGVPRHLSVEPTSTHTIPTPPHLLQGTNTPASARLATADTRLHGPTHPHTHTHLLQCLDDGPAPLHRHCIVGQHALDGCQGVSHQALVPELQDQQKGAQNLLQVSPRGCHQESAVSAVAGLSLLAAAAGLQPCSFEDAVADVCLWGSRVERLAHCCHGVGGAWNRRTLLFLTVTTPDLSWGMVRSFMAALSEASFSCG